MVVVPGPRIDVPELEQLVAVDRIVPVASRKAAVLLEHLRMGADHDRLVLGHVAQVLPEPVGDLVAQPQFVGFRGVLASVEDVVHEDVVHVADIGRIAGRTEVHLEIDRAQRIAQDGRLVVVVVADDVEGRRVHPLRIVDIGVVDVHVVVDQVAEVDAVARGPDRAAHADHVGNDHRAVSLGRTIDAVVLDLGIALHEQRMVLGGRQARFEHEIGLHLLLEAVDAFEELRASVTRRDFVFGRHRNEDEAALRKVARQRIAPLGVGLRAVEPVAHHDALDGQSAARHDAARDIRSLGIGGAAEQRRPDIDDQTFHILRF